MVAGSAWRVGRKPFHVASDKVTLCSLLLKCVRDRNPEACSRQGQRGHNNSSAVVQPLFGLAELSKSRIWPQRNAEPTNLSRGIRKSPQHMWFMGSQQSLHISSHPETACTTFNVFFPLVWMCYLFVYLFIFHSFIPLSLNSTTVFFISQVARYVCPWEIWVMEVMDV